MRDGTAVTLSTQPFRSDTSHLFILVGEHRNQGVNRRRAWHLSQRPGGNPAYIAIAVLEGFEQHRHRLLTGEISQRLYRATAHLAILIVDQEADEINRQGGRQPP